MANEYTFELSEGQPATKDSFAYLNGMVRTAYDRMNFYSKKTLSVKHLDTLLLMLFLMRVRMVNVFISNLFSAVTPIILIFLISLIYLSMKSTTMLRLKKINDISLLIHNDSELLREFFYKRKFTKAIDYYNKHMLLTKCI